MPKSSRKVNLKRPVRADDLLRLRLPIAVAISPNEKKIVMTVERIDQKANKYFSNLFLLDIATSRISQYTHGDHSDSQPTWSADADKIAFVSKRNGMNGIYIIPLNGGAERKIIELDGSIGNLQWTPDGSRLLFCLRYNDSHTIKDKEKKKEPPVYRHITRLFYRLDGDGYLPKDVFQIYTVEINSGKLKKITRGKRDNFDACLSPDGKLVAYVSNRSTNPDVDSLREDLFLIGINGGKERLISTPAGPVGSPAFSPDSKQIAYIGHDNPNDAWGVTNMHVWKVGTNGRPKARDLMPTFDRMAFDQSITDTSDIHDLSPIFWSADNKKIFFLSSDTGVTNLFSVPSRGGKPTRIFKGKCHVRAHSFAGRTRTATIVKADLNNPGDVETLPAQYGGEKKARRHTDFNPFLRQEVKLGRTREVLIKSFDGTLVQGWLLLPPQFTPSRKYPAILQIHGGPRTQYAHTFFHEMQFLAARGYVVLYTNPRGGSGRGETWADAIAGGWGDLDYKDCMAATDFLANLKYINSKKMGVTGGSYGGYMTNWIIGHTDRFAAAVTQRSVVDLNSFFGSSDIGFSLEREFDGRPWTNRENYERCSPINYFENVKTPVLIIHSEQDLRCHIEQAEQMFVKLKMMRKTVEMVRFPEEPHGLSRHGRPDRRLARLEWIDKWFGKYLK